MTTTELKSGDRVKYIAHLGTTQEGDTYGYGVVDRIDSHDQGTVWVLVGEKGYERSRPFNPSWIVEVIKPTMDTQPTANEARDLAKACVIRADRYWKSQMYFSYSEEIKKAQRWEDYARAVESNLSTRK